MPPLKWNETLAAGATAWAQEMARTGQLVHAPREGRGIERENLQKGLIGWGPDRFMQDWIGEKRYFRPGIYPDVCAGDWTQCAHYTQLIWPTTTDVGCGMATGSGYEWLVCRYSPGGNKEGKLVGAGAPDSATWDSLDCKDGRVVGIDPKFMKELEREAVARYARECRADTKVAQPVPDTKVEQSIVDERPALAYAAAIDRFQDARMNCSFDAAYSAFKDMRLALGKQRALVQALTEGGELGDAVVLKVARRDLKQMEEQQPKWSAIWEREFSPNAAEKASGPQPADESPTGVQQPTLPSGETFTPPQSTCEVEPL